MAVRHEYSRFRNCSPRGKGAFVALPEVTAPALQPLDLLRVKVDSPPGQCHLYEAASAAIPAHHHCRSDIRERTRVRCVGSDKMPTEGHERDEFRHSRGDSRFAQA